MTTEKKSTRKTADRPAAGPSDAQHQAESLARSLGQSAQQVWLAGLGALGRAQSEGTRLFESLVEEGERVEGQARRSAGSRADDVIQALGSSVEEARARASGTWDRWEKAFDQRMQRALVRLGVPGRDDIARLSQQVETLAAEVRRLAPARAPRKSAVKPAVAGTASATPSPAPLPAKPGPGVPGQAPDKPPGT